MRSSVNAFCRFPTLCAAVARRIAAVAVGPYMDDLTTVDALMAGSSGQDAASGLTAWLGGVLGPAKHMPARGHRVMLGVLVRLSALSSTGTIHYELKPETLQKLRARAAEIMRTGICTLAEASELRGIAGR